jgi:thioesterase domain-containing protein/acyl carrier protein
MKTEDIHQGQELRSSGYSASAVMPAQDKTTIELTRIWQEELSVDAISGGQNFFDLGGDSSLAVRMFARIDQLFGVKLPLATLYEAPTIDELARILRAEVPTSGWSPLVAIQPLGSRPPLFCMHGAGGTVLMYRDLSLHLGNDQPFFGLQAAGLDGSSAPLATIEEMAELYVKEIRRTQPRGPYFIAGYCMGGTVAFEVAQQLYQHGETVALLALLDTMNWRTIPLTAWSKISHGAQQLFFHAASFLSLDSEGRSKFFREKVHELKNRIPVWRGMWLSRFKRSPGLNSDAMILGKIWQTNDRASWNYVAKRYPGKITDIRPARQYRIFSKPGSKWDQLAQGGQEVVVLPVNPATMLVEPFVEQLAAVLRKSIDAAKQPGNSHPSDFHPSNSHPPNSYSSKGMGANSQH